MTASDALPRSVNRKAHDNKLKADWAKRNPEKVRASRQRHAEANRERLRKYREENRERDRAAKARYKRANPAANRLNVSKRRARMMAATPQWLTDGHRAEIAAIYADAVRLEAKTGVPHHVDHIVPLAGRTVCGLHVPWNLQPLPAPDNLKKSNRIVE